ncbi:type II secretion system protein [Sulfurimonas sp.]|uniref:type II secretion system protein n=1 Tax=Sulfurimonas sp. TaxID=2022749 RepID=UPI003D13C08F
MRKAFTLIELMISIVILSIMMVFLYKSYAELNIQNKQYDKATNKIKKIEQIKQTLFLDVSLSLSNTTVLLPQDNQHDIFFIQSTHSIHDRINPYVGYIIRDDKLYRIESLNQLKIYPIDLGIDYDIDYLGKVENFRVYFSKSVADLYLVDLTLKDMGRILIKIKSFS